LRALIMHEKGKWGGRGGSKGGLHERGRREDLSGAEKQERGRLGSERGKGGGKK